ncbi:soluble inorganic pyrophosphatase 4 [Tanacetum coccineum]
MASFGRESDFWVGDEDFWDIHGVVYEDDFVIIPLACPEHLMPRKEWEDVFVADFSKLRLVQHINVIKRGSDFMESRDAPTSTDDFLLDKKVIEQSMIATMTPPIEMPNKPADSYHHSHAPLNERILSSMKRRSAASHPWHDRSTNNIQIRVIYTQVEEGKTKLIYAAASEVVSLL